MSVEFGDWLKTGLRATNWEHIYMSDYRYVVIETYRSTGEGSSKKMRARPLPGQGLSAEMKVECSSKMRDAHPAGTLFLIQAKVTDREGGTPFLYTSHQWSYKIISPVEAAQAITAQGK
jgi:hypothetical protein